MFFATPDLVMKFKVLTTPLSPRYLLELDCDGDPAWDCIANMFLWVLRLLFTSKEDLQFPENSRVAGELAALSEGLAPASEPPPPVLPPRGHSMGKEGHSRTISDVSHTSTSSYGSQSTSMLLLLLLLLLLLSLS